MQDKTKIELVSAEVSGLWTTYMQDTLAVCMLKYFLNRLKDEEYRPVLQKALDISNGHIQVIQDKLNHEGLPIPHGFNENDVDANASRLFTDPFYIYYLLNVSQYGMHNYTLILNHIARQDMRDFFSTCISESIELFDMIVNILQQQGLYIKSPRVEFSKETDFIDKQNFFSAGWFGQKRRLSANEIVGIFSAARQNIIGGALINGFAQVANSKEIGEYFFRGRDLAWKKVQQLNNIFVSENIPIPSTSDAFVTDSTEAPFSDKLMLFQVIMLCGAGIGQSGLGLANSMRHDLQALHSSSMLETGKYLEDGLDLMIKNKWFEQPPLSISSRELVKY